MNSAIAEFFEEENIEYYKILSYASCREIRADIIGRKSFIPRSVIVFLIPYYTSQGENISRYAVSKDYHIYVKEVTDRLIERLTRLYPENSFAGFGDHSPIDERHAALIGGLGFLGKNNLLINEKYGSYVFIAEIICDVPEGDIGASNPEKISYCSSCGRCTLACPTGKLSGGGACLSEITQRKGELTDSEIDLMIKNNTVWGCDVCQSVCPHNKSPISTPIQFFHSDKIDKLTLQILSDMTDDEFKQRAYSWRKRETVKRNLEKVYRTKS